MLIKAVPLHGRLESLTDIGQHTQSALALASQYVVHDNAAYTSEAGALTSTWVTGQVQQQVRITCAAPECSVPDLVQAARHHAVSAFPCQC